MKRAARKYKRTFDGGEQQCAVTAARCPIRKIPAQKQRANIAWMPIPTYKEKENG